MKTQPRQFSGNIDHFSKAKDSATTVYPYESMTKPPGHSTQEFTCHFGKKMLLFVYKGEILSLGNIDMLVCNVTRSGQGGVLAKTIYDSFDKDYQNLKDRAFKSAFEGSVKVCKAGTSKFKYVAHVVLTKRPKNRSAHAGKVKDVFDKMLTEMYRFSCATLALPSLGSGKLVT